MITTQEYQEAVAHLASINKEDISANDAMFVKYKAAIETKVDYETQQKEKK